MKRKLIQAGALLLVMVGAVCCHAAIRTGLLTAGERCVTVLVPSLYFFSILAAFCVSSGLLEVFAAPLRRLRLKTDPRLLAVACFSQLGGYPVGAQLLHSMRRSGALTQEQERRMLCVCIGCGPGFLLGTVCTGLPLQAGLWLLLSVSLPNLVLAPLLSGGTALPETDARAKERGAVQLLTDSVESAAAAMLKIVGMVMAFAAVMAILGETGILHGIAELLPGIPEQTEALLDSLLEVSCITDYMALGGTLPMAAAILSFGGICVHLQAAAICDGNLPWLRFWLCRLLAAGMSYGLTAVGIRWFLPGTLPAVLQCVSEQAVVCGGSPLPGCCLLMMSVLLLKKQSLLRTEENRPSRELQKYRMTQK